MQFTRTQKAGKVNKLIQSLVAVLLASLIVLVVVCVSFVLRVERDALATVAELREAVTETKLAAQSVRKFADFQSEQLQSESNQKLIRQSLAVGAAFVGTARVLNTTTLPALNSALAELNLTSREVTSLTRRTSDSINSQLLPEATRATASLNQAIAETAKTLNTSVSSTSGAVEKLINAGVLSVEEANRLLGDPKWQESLANVEKSTAEIAKASQSLNQMTASGALAAAELPQIAKDVQAFTASQSKYSKLVILARIIRALTF